MKRKLFLYGLLVAVLVTGVPYFTGQVAKHRLYTFAEALSHSEHGSVTVLNYESGWRRSSAKTRITLTSGILKALLDELGEESLKIPENAPLNKPLKIVLEHEIVHGPFVQKEKANWKDWLFVQALVHSKLSISEDAKALLEQELGEKDFISMTTEIAMDNQVHLSIRSKPISVSENNVEHMIWKGMEGEWHFTDDLNIITGEMTVPGFSFETAAKEYWIDDLLLNYDSVRLSDTKSATSSVSKSETKAQIAKITVRSQNQQTLIFQNVTANNRLDKNHGYQFTLKIASVDLDAHEYGGLEVNALLQNAGVQNFTGKGVLQTSAVLLPELARYYATALNAESTHEADKPTSIASLIEEAFKNKIIIDANNNATMSFEFVEGKALK